MRKLILMSLFVCSTLCYAQEDDPFGLYKKGTSKSKNYDLEKVYKVKKERPKPFFGLNVGLGGDFGKGFSTLEGSLGVDVAGWINNRFAMGCYLSYQTITSFSLGLLFVHGDYNNAGAFLWGIGYTTPDVCLYNKEKEFGRSSVKITPNLRLGYMLRNGLYFMTDMEGSNNYFRTYRNDFPFAKSSFDINFRIGYRFNLGKKQKK
ncbi:MAG: hypothetical protein ACI30B_01270 [Paludibacteraceae bacterium]